MFSAASREHEPDIYVPYIGHAAPGTVLLDDGSLLAMLRLDGATFAFRTALARGASLGAAATQALTSDPAFDPGAALLDAVDEQLFTSLGSTHGGAR